MERLLVAYFRQQTQPALTGASVPARREFVRERSPRISSTDTVPAPTPPQHSAAIQNRLQGNTFADSIDGTFYQTIIRNNLFAPLGTDLHRKPVPGASVKLIATLTRKDPADATAIVENTTTGEQKTVGLGDTIAGYRIREIHPKQILLAKSGEPAVWKFMTHFLLNSKRR